jgi:ligand-binding sensor domain-containing protein/two-component sensor histidine kinase
MIEMKAIKTIWLFFFPIFLFSQVSDLVNLPALEIFGPEVGFRQREVFDIIKSSRGYIWVGTNNGLGRFDGHNFVFYNSNDTEGKNAISGDYVNSICEDDQGRIWMIASNKINMLDQRTNRFYHPELTSPNGVVSKYDAYSILFNPKDKKVWISTSTGIFSSSGKSIRLSLQNLDKRIPHHGKLTLDKNQNLCLLTNAGIFRLDEKYRVREIITHQKRDLNNQGFISFHEGNNNDIFAGTYFDGILVRKKNAYKTVTFNQRGLNAVFSIEQFPGMEHNLMLGTSSGLYILNKNTLKIRKIDMNFFTSTEGFQGNIYCVRKVDNREIWIGATKGLGLYDLKKNIFTNANLNFLRKKDAEVTKVEFDGSFQDDQIAWIFSRYNGIFRYDMKSGKNLLLPQSLAAYADSLASDFALKNNTIWISNFKKGLIGYDLKRDKTVFISDPSGHEPYLNLILDRKGKLWLTGFSGLYTFEGENKKISRFRPLTNWLKKKGFHPYIHDMAIERQNKFWMLLADTRNQKQVVVFDQNAGTFSVKHGIHCELCRSNNPIEGIQTGYQNWVYVFSNKCLLKLPTKKPVSSAEQSGCLRINDKIFTIEETPNGFWISTLGGVLHGRKKDFTVGSEYNYYNSNISVPHIAPYIKYSKATDKLYIFSVNQFSVIREQDLDESPSPQPYITNMFINNQKVDHIDSLSQQFTLPYHKNTLAFEFSNFSFTHAQLNTYYYRIAEKIDPESAWIKARDNTVHFLNLRPGKYTLEVSSRNFLGIPGKNNRLINFEIRPPFWNTWWFYSFVFIGIAGFFYGLYRYRLAQNRKLEILRLQIARDLHDDIGSHLSQIKILSEIESWKSRDPEVFERINTSLTVVMSNLTEIVWSINPKNSRLTDVISRIQEFAIETLEPLNINLFFSIDQTATGLNFDLGKRRHLYLIFKEAITNIAKYSLADRVELKAYKDQQNIIISIQDNGTGFDPFLIKRGNGLLNMKSRAELLHARLNILTAITGTEVRLEIKV